MKSLEARFAKILEKNPFWSSHTCFAQAVKNQNFSKKTIHLWFNKLVEKDDYDKSDKKDIISYLVKLSNPTEEGMK